MKPARTIFFRRRRRLMLGLAGALGLVLLLALAALGLAISPLGRSYALGKLTLALAGTETTKLAYGKASGGWPGEIVLENVTLSDKNGPWLAIKRFALKWYPLALVSKHVDIDSIVVDTPVLLRSPESTPTDAAAIEDFPQSGFKLPTLPFRVSVETISLTKGRIVAPAPIAFDADGSLALTDRAARVALEVRRKDGVDEHLIVDGAVDRDRRALKLAVDGVAAPNGLFATLAGVEGLPPVRVKADGAGPPENWRLKGDVVAGDYGHVALDSKIVWTETISATLSGTYEAGAAIPKAWAGLAGPSLAFTATVAQKEQGEDVTAAFHGAGGDMSVAFSTPNEEALAGTLHLVTRATVAPAEGVVLGPLKLDATLAGTADVPKLDARLDAEALKADVVDLKQLSAALALDGTRRDGALSLRVTGTSGALAFDSGNGFRPVSARSAWTVTAARVPDGAWTVDRLTLSVPGVAVDGMAKIAANGEGQATATLVADDLRPLAPVADLDLAGGANLRTELHWVSGAFGVTVRGQTNRAVVSGIDTLPITGPSADLAVDLSHATDAPWVIDSADIKGVNGFRAQGAGAATGALALHVRLAGDLAGLSPQIGADLAGAYDATLAVGGNWHAPLMTVRLDAPKAALYGHAIGKLRADFEPPPHGPGPDQRLAGLVSLQSDAEFGNMAVAARIAQMTDRTLVISDIAGDVFGGALVGAVSLPTGGAKPSGDLSLKYPDLSELAGYVVGKPRRAQGRADLVLALRARAPEPALKAQVKIESVSIPDEGLGLGKFTADVAVAQDDAVEASLIISDAQMQGLNRPFRLGAVKASAKGPASRTALSLEASGIADGAGKLSLAGIWAHGAKSPSLTLSQLNATLWSTSISAEKPIVVGLDKNMSLREATLSVGEGSLSASLLPASRGFVLKAGAKDFPLPFLGRALDTGWPQGTLDATVSLDTASARPHGQADLKVSDALFVPHGLATVTPLSGAASAVWDGRSLRVNATMDRDATSPFQLSATLPLVLRAPGALGMPASGALSAKAHWHGRVGAFWALLPIDMHRLDGDGTLDVTASGTWGDPKVVGKLAVAQGHYENLETGTRLSDLAVDLSANLAAARLTVTGGDGVGGTLDGSGEVKLQPTQHFPVSATLDLKKLRLLGLDDVTATATGALRLGGSFERLKLAGNLTFDSVEARIPERIPQSVVTLPVEYANGAQVFYASDTKETKASAPIDLDLGVSIPGRAYLRGRGLTSEWKGDIKIVGTLDTPDLKGGINLVRGTLAFAGRSFPLTRGGVSFAGGGDLDPDLDIAAERQVQATTVTIAVTGTASEPRVTISSVPTLPKEDAMALLLFGKSASTLTPLELLDVTRGVAELTGTGPFGGGLGLLDKTRSALGFDVLSIDVDDNAGNNASNVAGSTAITAGRYIRKGVYVGLKQGARSGSSAVQLEVELTPHITVETEVGAERQSSGVNWKWDY